MELLWIPLLVNLYMGFHKKRCLDQFQICDVLLHRLYVDDIIYLLNQEQDAHVFLNS